MNLLLLSTLLATAVSAEPSVQIKDGLIRGFTSNKVENFFGVPYADPPVGDLRLRQPRPLSKPLGTFDATSSPRLCTQKIMAGDLPIIDTWPDAISGSLRDYNRTSNNQGEDCLTVNVQRPVDTKPDAKLPVLFWIFGGGFEQGSTNRSDWSTVVAKSIEQDGVIVVAVNYRLNTFGFLGGKELQAEGATNLGLHDQRLGLEWVHENIAAFGGDPDKVTLWGQSAGSISTYNHLLINNGDNRSIRTGKPLFRAAIMDSGTAFDAEPVDSATAQAQYNYIVSAVGCASANSTLDCLRAAPWQKLYDATNSLPHRFLSQDGFFIDFVPRPDPTSSFFTSAKLRPGQSVADVPIIVAHQEDEVTSFLQATSNLNTTAKFIDMLHQQYPTTPIPVFETLVSYYANNASYGAPFRTNATQDVTYPNSKINSAVITDIDFIFTARSFLDSIAGPQPCVHWSSPVYALQGSYFYGTPITGSFHGSDLALLQGGTTGVSTKPFENLVERYLRFVKGEAPAYEGGSEWPVYGEQRSLLRINGGGGDEILRFDSLRGDAFEYFKSVEGEIVF